jgi:hypothetical protein
MQGTTNRGTINQPSKQTKLLPKSPLCSPAVIISSPPLHYPTNNHTIDVIHKRDRQRDCLLRQHVEQGRRKIYKPNQPCLHLVRHTLMIPKGVYHTQHHTQQQPNNLPSTHPLLMNLQTTPPTNPTPKMTLTTNHPPSLTTTTTPTTTTTSGRTSSISYSRAGSAAGGSQWWGGGSRESRPSRRPRGEASQCGCQC